MFAYDANTLALLATGRVAMRDFLLFDFPSGLWGFHSGSGPIPWDGVTYVGSGKHIKVERDKRAIGLAASSRALTLSSIPNTDLTPDVLATIEQQDYHNKVATISRMYINPDTREVLSMERSFTGFISTIKHHLQVGGEATLICQLESKSILHQKRGYRRRTGLDQRAINPVDGGLDNAATIVQQSIYWGRINPQQKASFGGSLSNAIKPS